MPYPIEDSGPNLPAYPVPPTAVIGGLGPPWTKPSPTPSVLPPVVPTNVSTLPPGGIPGINSPMTDEEKARQGAAPRKVPSIEEILGADPFYSQLEALYKAMGLDERQIADYKIARMKSLYGNANDPISLMGRAKQSYDDRLRTIINTLAAHGMIFSGEQGWQDKRAALDYARAQYDLNFKLEDYINGVKEGILAADKNRQLALIQAKADAVSRWIADNMDTGDSGGTYPTTPPPDLGD